MLPDRAGSSGCPASRPFVSRRNTFSCQLIEDKMSQRNCPLRQLRGWEGPGREADTAFGAVLCPPQCRRLWPSRPTGLLQTGPLVRGGRARVGRAPVQCHRGPREKGESDTHARGECRVATGSPERHLETQRLPGAPLTLDFGLHSCWTMRFCRGSCPAVWPPGHSSPGKPMRREGSGVLRPPALRVAAPFPSASVS